MQTEFYPSRRIGLISHAIFLGITAGGAGLAFTASLRQESGSDLVFYLVLSVLLVLPVPLVLYRIYALLQARYILERDGLRIRWGLRAEDIPLSRIEWIRPANEMGMSLKAPFFSVPGAIIGSTNIEGLGTVEFIASDFRTMLLIATPERIYAISPAEPKTFGRVFRQIIELGSLSPFVPYSTHPAAFLSRVFTDRLARVLLLAGFALTMILLITVSFRIPGLAKVSLGFNSNRQPFAPGPPESLLLLAVLGGFAFALDLLAGLFFYPRESQRPLAYLLWGASLLTPLLLLVGALIAR
jgi:hypothetical protein